MNNLRRARERIDPALIKRAREVIAGAANPEASTVRADGSIPVDRARTAEIFRKYMVLRAEKSGRDLPG